MFSGCPSVCACVRTRMPAGGPERSPTYSRRLLVDYNVGKCRLIIGILSVLDSPGTFVHTAGFLLNYLDFHNVM